MGARLRKSLLCLVKLLTSWVSGIQFRRNIGLNRRRLYDLRLYATNSQNVENKGREQSFPSHVYGYLYGNHFMAHLWSIDPKYGRNIGQYCRHCLHPFAGCFYSEI